MPAPAPCQCFSCVKLLIIPACTHPPPAAGGRGNPEVGARGPVHQHANRGCNDGRHAGGPSPSWCVMVWSAFAWQPLAFTCCSHLYAVHCSQPFRSAPERLLAGQLAVRLPGCPAARLPGWQAVSLAGLLGCKAAAASGTPCSFRQLTPGCFCPAPRAGCDGASVGGTSGEAAVAGGATCGGGGEAWGINS